MRKLLLTLLIAAGTMTSFRAAADPTPTMAYELYFFNDLVDNFVITAFNYSVTSNQRPGIFDPPYTYTVASSTAEPVGLIDYGGYWFTPSSTSPLQIVVNSGLTATVQNTSSSAQTLRMGIEFVTTDPAAHLPNVVIYGTYVTVPGNGSATLPIPTGSATYQKAALTSLFPTEPYPVPVAFFISY
jgi:hypothetical protein